MSPRAFTDLGLALDIAGAILLFFFGLPHKVLIDDDSADWVDRVERRYQRIAWVCKRLGLPLLILGFVGQWIGVACAG